jgi:hypothetical protein
MLALLLALSACAAPYVRVADRVTSNFRQKQVVRFHHQHRLLRTMEKAQRKHSRAVFHNKIGVELVWPF